MTISFHPGLGEAARGFLSRQHQLLIGGRMVESDSGLRTDILDPATGDVIATAAEASATDVDRAVEAARRKFTPEFMNRIDKTVVFKTLRDEHLSQILEIELGMVQQRVLMAAGANQFVFNCTPGAKSFLLKEGTDPRYGARHLKRAIERHLVFPLANLVATAQVKLGDFVRVDMASENQLIFVKEAENTMAPVLLERYGAAAANMPNVRAARTAVNAG